MINIKVRTYPPRLSEIIGDAPRNARGRMTRAAAVYIIGNTKHGLKHYPAYKYVTRRRAYGVSFFSDAQRRFVMAGLRSGSIKKPGKSHRTRKLQRGWHIVGTGTKVSIRNSEDSAVFVQGDKQSRHEALVGWRMYSKVVEDNSAGMIRAANAELRNYFKENGVAVK